MNVIAYADVGGISKNSVRPDAAIFADRVQVAVAAEKFGVFFAAGVAKLDVKLGELAVTHGKVADDFL
jgi:hypothetical protein